MEAHDLNFTIMIIVSFTLCIRRQEVGESGRYPQSKKKKKTFYRMYDILERNNYNRYRL